MAAVNPKWADISQSPMYLFGDEVRWGERIWATLLNRVLHIQAIYAPPDEPYQVLYPLQRGEFNKT
jgi:hypothetical protein